jgi:hypothetical protein
MRSSASSQASYHQGMRTLLAVGVAALLTAGTAGAAQSKPALRLAKLQPLTVEGRNFRAREHVKVQVLAPTTAVRKAVANMSGSFVVKFPDIPATRCDMVRVVATGAGNRRVVLKMLPSPACAPA